jgi:hypothetical protein
VFGLKVVERLAHEMVAAEAVCERVEHPLDPSHEGELAKRRAAIRDALADTLERVARRHGFKLRFPAPVLATPIAASLNGLTFERAADTEALPDEVFAEFVTAVLGCAISAPLEQ